MKCEICNEEFEEQYFDIPQNKCILHCEKDDSYCNKQVEFREVLNKSIKKKSQDSKITFKNIHFIDDYDINDIMATDDSFILFYECHFINSLTLKITNHIFRFEKCHFQKEWKHIISQETKFIKCQFDEYVYENISEDKEKINHLFFDCGFNSIDFKGVHFTEKLFKFSNRNKYSTIESLNLTYCIFEKDIIFNSNREENDADNFTITKLDFSESTFKGKVKIQFCEIKDANFYNTKFKDLADFYRTKFEKVNFERTDFEKISVFSETEFNCDVNFKYTKFLGKAIFRDTVITGILNLRNSIFDDEANFLDITSQKRKREKNKDNEFIGEIKSIQVANRETARVIKNFYDNSNNIIEANRFYALEMAEREKELEHNKRQNLVEWFIFKAHKISSNHSQDWLLTMLWMFAITFVFAVLDKNTYCTNDMILLSILTSSSLILLAFLFACISLKWFLFTLSICVPFLTQTTFKDFANLINPFSIMTGHEKLTFSMLIYKVVIAYLIYQFIVSIRQNTKRK